MRSSGDWWWKTLAVVSICALLRYFIHLQSHHNSDLSLRTHQAALENILTCPAYLALKYVCSTECQAPKTGTTFHQILFICFHVIVSENLDFIVFYFISLNHFNQFSYYFYYYIFYSFCFVQPTAKNSNTWSRYVTSSMGDCNVHFSPVSGMFADDMLINSIQFYL